MNMIDCRGVSCLYLRVKVVLIKLGYFVDSEPQPDTEWP
jgi:hypothetical protein